MPHARIYRPDKTAMQSGKAGMKHWVLEFEPETPYFIEGLMGWTGMRDTLREVQLTFPTADAAVAYAQANGISYTLNLPKERRQQRKAYADNFKFRKTS